MTTAAVRVPHSWSDVTAAWMTAALSTRLPGTVVEGVKLGPVSAGTNARAQVTLSYREGCGPPSVFVKRAGTLRHRLALAALGAASAEARLAASGVDLPLDRPLPYAAGVDRRRLAAVVVMDDVVAGGGRPNDPTVPLDVVGVEAGLAGLARLHAAHWGRPLPRPLGFLRPWRLGPGWAAVSVASLWRGLRRVDAFGVAIPPGVDPRSLGRQFQRSAVLAASEPRTVLHGDPHPGNTYTTADGGTGFYDWQLVRTGHWSHDVGYFLAGSLDPSDRRAHERGLLAGYLAALRRAGVEPPDADEAWMRYGATPAFGLATWVHTLSFGSFQPVDVCVATISRFATAYDDLETGRSIVA